MPEDEIYNGGDIDTDALLADFEANYTEEGETTETETDEEPNAQEVPGEQGDGEPEGEVEGDDPEHNEDNPQNDPDLHKRNEAFKNMREQIKELTRYKEFTERMARDNGLEDPNQIFDMYNEQMLQKEAQERGIDLESMKEIDAARRQQEMQQIEAQREAFAKERQETIERYGLNDEQVEAVHEFAINNNLQYLGFEQAYKLANFDNLIDNARNEGRQKYLTDKKKRQQSAALNAGNNNVNNSDVSTGDLTDDEFQKTLESMGIEL